MAVSRWLYAAASILFFLGAQLYAQRKPWIVPAIAHCRRAGAMDDGQLFQFNYPLSVAIPSAVLFLAISVIFLAGKPPAGNSR